MKKITLSIFAIITLLTAKAQQAEVGIKGGLNISNLAGNENSNLPGYLLGFFVKVKVNEKFYFQPEFLYSRQSSNFPTQNVKNSSFTNQPNKRLNLDYVNVPIMGLYNIKNNFFLEFGPQISFLVDYDVPEIFLGAIPEPLFNKVDYGLNFGLGYKISKSVSAGARYSHGLKNIFQTDYVDADQKNRVLNFTVNFIY